MKREKGKVKTAFLVMSASIILFAGVIFTIGTKSTEAESIQKTSPAPLTSCQEASCNKQNLLENRLKQNRIRTAVHNQFAALRQF